MRCESTGPYRLYLQPNKPGDKIIDISLPFVIEETFQVLKRGGGQMSSPGTTFVMLRPPTLSSKRKEHYYARAYASLSLHSWVFGLFLPFVGLGCAVLRHDDFAWGRRLLVVTAAGSCGLIEQYSAVQQTKQIFLFEITMTKMSKECYHHPAPAQVLERRIFHKRRIHSVEYTMKERESGCQTIINFGLLPFSTKNLCSSLWCLPTTTREVSAK